MAHLLHFQLLPTVGYGIPWVQSLGAELEVYDIDARSDDVTLHYARLFLEQAEHLWVTIAADGSSDLSKVQAVLRPLARRRPPSLQIILPEALPGLEVLFRALQPQEVHHLPETEAWPACIRRGLEAGTQ